MKNTRKKFNYRVNKTSKKLKGGAGKLNNKKQQKKRPDMTAQDYENQLLKSFPYGFVLHGEVGTKARKTQDVLQREFYEALNEANNTRVNKRSTVSGIPKNEAQSEGLFDAMAKGQQEGLTTYSRMQSAMRRATQPISRMTGVPISEDPRGLMTQAQGLMATGKSRGRVGSRGTSSSVSTRRGSIPIRVTSKSSKTPGIPTVPGMPIMPGMPGATTAQDTGMPPAPPGETGNFMNTGENFPDSEQVVLEEADTSDPDECPCCNRAFTDETKLNEEWIDGLTEKIKDAKTNLKEKKQKKAKNLEEKKDEELAEEKAKKEKQEQDKEEEDTIEQCKTNFTNFLSVDARKLDKLIEEAQKQKEKLEAKAKKKEKKGKKGKGKNKKEGNNTEARNNEVTKTIVRKASNALPPIPTK